MTLPDTITATDGSSLPKAWFALDMIGDGHQKLSGPGLCAHSRAEDTEVRCAEVQGRVAAGTRKPALPGSRAGAVKCPGGEVLTSPRLYSWGSVYESDKEIQTKPLTLNKSAHCVWTARQLP